MILVLSEVTTKLSNKKLKYMKFQSAIKENCKGKKLNLLMLWEVILKYK